MGQEAKGTDTQGASLNIDAGSEGDWHPGGVTEH